VRIAVLHPQIPFMRGGAELHVDALVHALREAGHEAEQVTIAGKWYPPTELAHQMAVWRSFDISESNGQPVDAVIALKFPAYLVKHERKIVWLIHQHRPAYDLWDQPEYADLSRREGAAAIRDLVWQADRLGLGEAWRLFTNSRNVSDRLRRSLGLRGQALYHRSPATEALLAREPEEVGDYIVAPSRFDRLKRQDLAIEAMRHVETPVSLVLVGRGPDGPALRRRIDRLGLRDRVRLEAGVTDERLLELYGKSLGVYFGPYDEDYGYITIEGFAAARPVVTLTDSGGPLEFVRDGETGLVVEPKATEIAGAFDRLWSDRAGAKSWGLAGQRLLRDTVPEWPEVVARLLA
jgi:glycosyltransferase involved in cell wall biosynthesis